MTTHVKPSAAHPAAYGQCAGLRFLFVKSKLAWPRATGHDVHGYNMMRALGRIGHEVVLATTEQATPRALDGLDLRAHQVLDGRPVPAAAGGPVRLARLQRRFCSYWGVQEAHLAAVARLIDACQPDVVVAVGLDALPYLSAPTTARRVWYAADEPVLASLSLFRFVEPGTWPHLRHAAVKALYEHTFRSVVDRAWVVSEADRRAMDWLIGRSRADVIPNGVNGEEFQPTETKTIDRSCVFWGRLDNDCNQRAIEWFLHRVWPVLLRNAPDARFAIYGFHPTDAVRRAAETAGVSLFADRPDLRVELMQYPVAVFPFVSGGGVKNKVLEAAGLARAIVCTPRACNGLLANGPSLPLVQARTGAEWAARISELWQNRDRCRTLGASARAWVLETHDWAASAQRAVASVQAEGSRRGS